MEELKRFLEAEIAINAERQSDKINPCYDGVCVGNRKARKLRRKHISFCERLLLMAQKETEAHERREGKYKGRKPVEVNPYEFEKLMEDVEAKRRTATSVMNELGLTRTTFYKLVGEWKTKTGRFVEE